MLPVAENDAPEANYNREKIYFQSKLQLLIINIQHNNRNPPDLLQETELKGSVSRLSSISPQHGKIRFRLYRRFRFTSTTKFENCVK